MNVDLLYKVLSLMGIGCINTGNGIQTQVQNGQQMQTQGYTSQPQQQLPAGMLLAQQAQMMQAGGVMANGQMMMQNMQQVPAGGQVMMSAAMPSSNGMLMQPNGAQGGYQNAAGVLNPQMMGVPPVKIMKRPWHSTNHQQIRTGMVERIISLLKQRRPNAEEKWHEKLPLMAKRLEEALYGQAESFNDYADANTLKLRLQQLAISMGGKQAMKPAVDAMGRPIMTGVAPVAASGTSGVQMMQAPNSQLQQQQQASQQQAYLQQQQQQQQQQMLHMRSASNVQQQGYSQQMLSNQQPQQQQYMHSMATMNQYQIPQGQQNMVYGHSGMMTDGTHSMNMVDSNAMPQQQYAQQQQQQHYMQQLQQQQNMQKGMTTMLPPQGQVGQSMMMHQQGNGPMMQQQQQPNQQPNQSHGGNLNSNEEHRRQVLKQQQQRLLLLRHASKCPHDAGRCPITPHCASMKSLWKHIMSCKDQECKVPHCVSSRYVLSHYSKCKDQGCPVCAPVREAIRKNYEKSRDIINNSSNMPPGMTGGAMLPGMVNNLQHPQQHGQSGYMGGTLGISGQTGGRQDPAAAHGIASSGPQPKTKKDTKKQKKGAEEPSNLTIQLPRSSAQAGAHHSNHQLNGQLSMTIQSAPRAQPAVQKSIYPLDPISCALYSFSPEHVTAHFKTIHEGVRLSAARIKDIFLPILEEILRQPNAQSVFGVPVDPVALGLPDYAEIVKVPMDLGTVKRKLETSSYRDVQHLVADVHLTFDNAILYNPKNSVVSVLAKSLKKEFDQRYKSAMQEVEKTLDSMRQNPDACLVCGEVRLLYEPPVYYCNGRCGGQRIRRNANFYSGCNNTYHWCSPCFSELKDNQPIRLPDCTITKFELGKTKRKHSEESEEPWVQVRDIYLRINLVCYKEMYALLL